MDFADFAEIVGVPPDRADEDTPAPTLPPRLLAVYVAHGELATDESGRPSVLEREALLDVLGIDDPGLREVWWTLWGQITTAVVVEQRRRMDALLDKDETGAS